VPRRLARPGALPVEQLPELIRTFADLPYAPFTEAARQYHLRTYVAWCAERQRPPWPPTLSGLMQYAADRAPGHSYFTVREHVRIVSMVERRRSGIDLYARIEMQQLLDGIRRDSPPRPVLPLRPAQVHELLAYRPATGTQRLVRSALLLSYAAGLSLSEHNRIRCEMIVFERQGATISDLGPDRPLVFIGAARDIDRCPVRALRQLVGERTSGPLYTSVRSRGKEKGWTYWGLGAEMGRYGRTANVAPLSNDRIRLAGLIEQARHIDLVRLAHFHGYRSVNTLAALLGRYIEVNAGTRFPRRRRGA
jgi:hypothetical protein